MNQQRLRTRNASTASIAIRWLVVIFTVAVLGLLGSGSLLGQRSQTADKDSSSRSPLTQTNRDSNFEHERQSRDGIRGEGTGNVPRVATGKVDSLGRAVTVSCASCHANFEPNFKVFAGEQLQQFHQGLKFSHGKLNCLSCHNSKNYNLLELAGDQSLDFSQSQTLCGQCHSKQRNDYEHGAHGGMNGHWDQKRGARLRKLCIDCHDPHSPAFPAMVPTFKPHDRFLEKPLSTETRHPLQASHD